MRYNSQANAISAWYEMVEPVQLLGPVPARRWPYPGCNNNFDIWSSGTRLQYDFTKTLYIGVDFLYQHLDTATCRAVLPTATRSSSAAQIN